MADVTLCVAMCTYNGGAFLREQLESIAGQSRLPDSMVVIDDASSDGTLAELRRFARKAAFPVQVGANERNVGFRENFERVIRAADGEVIVLADQDDVWLPEKLERLEAAFRAAPATALVFSNAEVVDERLRPLGYTLWQAVHFTERRQEQFRSGRAFEVLLQGNVVAGSAMAFRRHLRDLVLPLSRSAVHDAWIALLAAAVAPAAIVPAPLVRYRQHGGNQLGVKRRDLIERIAWAKQVKGQHFEHRLAYFREARARLEEVAECRSGTLALLDDSIEHLAVRVGLPQRRIRRLGMICRELANGRYRQLGNGWSSALRDLVA